jgi:hypothetical protein
VRVPMQPGARVGPVNRGHAEAQLAKQFRDLLQHPIPGVSAAPREDNLLLWDVMVRPSGAKASQRLPVFRGCSASDAAHCMSLRLSAACLPRLHSSPGLKAHPTRAAGSRW